MLTNEEIEKAKVCTNYSLEEAHHEHNDCIRIAYEWLDAQQKIKLATTKGKPLKHIIEKWAGRYISRTDVDVAAELHPEIKGTYPFFNISSRLTRPSKTRLDGIGEAFTQDYKERANDGYYAKDE